MNSILGENNEYVQAPLPETQEQIATLSGIPLGVTETGEIAVKCIIVGTEASQ